MAPRNWLPAVLISGGVAGAMAMLYYLTKEFDEDTSKKDDNSKQTKKIDVHTATKQQVLQVLQKIIESQKKMREVMKQLTAELTIRNHTVDEAYQKVKALQPEDPLEVTGLTMAEFDLLLEKYQSDNTIRDYVGQIMGAPGPFGVSDKAGSIDQKLLIDLHKSMLAHLQTVVNEFKTLSNRDSYDMKTVTIAAQAIVSSKIEQQYNLSSEDIESAVLLHHQALAADPEFARINVQMQTTMSSLMGSHLSSQFF